MQQEDYPPRADCLRELPCSACGEAVTTLPGAGLVLCGPCLGKGYRVGPGRQPGEQHLTRTVDFPSKPHPSCPLCDRPAVAEVTAAQREDYESAEGDPIYYDDVGTESYACADHVEAVREAVRDSLTVVDRPLYKPESDGKALMSYWLSKAYGPTLLADDPPFTIGDPPPPAMPW